MPYFLGLMQQTGVFTSQAAPPETAPRPGAPSPEAVPNLELEEVQEVDASGPARLPADSDPPATPQPLQPTSPEVRQAAPLGAYGEAASDKVIAETTPSPPVPQAPGPVREFAAAAPERPPTPPTHDAVPPGIEVIETIEVSHEVPPPVPAAVSPPQPGPGAPEEKTLPNTPPRGPATGPATALLTRVMTPSLAAVRAWVASTPETMVPEIPSDTRHPAVEIEQRVEAPQSGEPLSPRRLREPLDPPTVEQSFSLHIGTIQLSLEAPPQPPVETPHSPPMPPPPAPTSASQALRWRRRYLRV